MRIGEKCLGLALKLENIMKTFSVIFKVNIFTLKWNRKGLGNVTVARGLKKIYKDCKIIEIIEL